MLGPGLDDRSLALDAPVRGTVVRSLEVVMDKRRESIANCHLVSTLWGASR